MRQWPLRPAPTRALHGVGGGGEDERRRGSAGTQGAGKGWLRAVDGVTVPSSQSWGEGAVLT